VNFKISKDYKLLSWYFNETCPSKQAVSGLKPAESTEDFSYWVRAHSYPIDTEDYKLRNKMTCSWSRQLTLIGSHGLVTNIILPLLHTTADTYKNPHITNIYIIPIDNSNDIQ
jgi:hypothetical protein